MAGVTLGLGIRLSVHIPSRRVHLSLSASKPQRGSSAAVGERGEGGGKFPRLSACLAAASLEPGSRASRGFPRSAPVPPVDFASVTASSTEAARARLPTAFGPLVSSLHLNDAPPKAGCALPRPLLRVGCGLASDTRRGPVCAGFLKRLQTPQRVTLDGRVRSSREKNKNKQSQLIVINKIQVCPQDGRSHLLTDDGSGGND